MSDAPDIERYARHLLLPEVGRAGQARLGAARVAVVGAGGLGCPVLQYLAAAGVGTLGIIDFDDVDLSNLQRQILHTTADVGRPKVDSAAESLQALNPGLVVHRHPVRLDVDTALDLLSGYDLVVDGTDDFPTRYLINDATEILGLPLVYGAIHRFAGQVAVFNHQGGPSYRDLYPDPPPAGTLPNCAEGGVIGVLPGVIGTLQATEVLKILLGIGRPLSGRLLLYDALTLEFQTLALQRDPARERPRTLSTTVLPRDERPSPAVLLPPSEVQWRLDQGWDPFVLDVRTAMEADITSLPWTTDRIAHRELSAHLARIPRDRDVLVYCKAGTRSRAAARVLHEAGIAGLFEIDGGVSAWRALDPTIPVY